MKMKTLILYLFLVNITDAEVINKKAILEILKSGANKKTITSVAKNNYKDKKEDNNLPLGNLPNLPLSSIELSNRYNSKIKNYFNKVVTKKKVIAPGAYAKEIKFE